MNALVSLFNLGSVLRALRRLPEAEASYQRALEIKPDYAEPYNNLGNALLDQAKRSEAEASYRRALELQPDFAEAHTSLLFLLSQKEGVDAEELFAEHCRFGEQFEAPLRGSWHRHSNSRDPERCLQIGFVSGDLRIHSVAYLIEPVLVHLASFPQFALHAYSNHIREDSVTRRLRGYFAHWHPIAGLSKQTYKKFSTLVIDNGSSEKPIEASLPGVEVVCLPENVGFAGANNHGVELCGKSKWIALLNPDAIPADDWLERLVVAAEEEPDVACFASRMIQAERPTVLNGAGDAYHVSGRVRRRGHGAPADGRYEHKEEVFSACAAAALYRREALMAAGGFDEDFFC